LNITTYIREFNRYLASLNGKDGSNYTVTNSSNSILLYADEFKDFIGNKIGKSVDSISINDLLDMEYTDGKLVKKSEKSASEEDKTHVDNQFVNLNTPELQSNSEIQQNEDDATILDFLNTFMEDEGFKNAIDYDKDETITKEEINSFLNGIKGLDKDDSSISLDDILAVSKSIQDGTYNPLNPNEALNQEQSQTIQNNSDNLNINSPSSLKGTSSSKGSGGTRHSSYEAGDVAENSDNPKDNSANLLNMSEQQLQTELTNANNTLNTKQNELSEIMSGTNSEITTKQGEVDSLYQAYLDEANRKNPELAQIIQEVTAKEQEVTTAELKVSSCENNVSICENAKANADSILLNLQTKKSELEGKQGSSNITEEQKASISSKLESIKAEIIQAETKQKEAKEALDTANAEKTQAIEEKTQKESELAQLNIKKTELETNELQSNPTLQQAKEAYEKAKAELDSTKNQLAETKKSEITQAVNYVNEVQNAIKTNKTQADNTNFSPEPEYNFEFGRELAAAARKMAEGMGSVGYCLRGVAKTLKKFFNGKTALSSLSSAYMSAEKLENDPMLKKCFTKVDVKKEDLTSLPAGCIVVWQRGGPTEGGKKHGHIAITLGNGKEASDHVQKQVVRDCAYSVYYPTGNYKEFIKT